MNLNLSILTDKGGIFKGLQIGNKTITIDEWNRNFESMSIEEFKRTYGHWYTQLVGNEVK